MGYHRVKQDRQYELGARLLAIRTRIALTQQALAAAIGVHRRSVQNWETGVSYPKAETFQRVLAVLLSYGAFTAGNEHAEVEALWECAMAVGARGFPPFDPIWFAHTWALQQPEHLEVVQHVDHTAEQAVGSVTSATHAPAPATALVDWGESIAVPMLYGRTTELATLRSWVIDHHCRLVAVIGLGGIGKSSLAVKFSQQIAEQFDVVLFRSLQNGLPLADLLDQTLRAVATQPIRLPDLVADKIALLVQLFRERRCLFILDNVESILQPGALTGTYRTGYAAYGDLLRSLGEREHQSCLLVTSREKPGELGPLEGQNTPVRTLYLSGLDEPACRDMLDTRAISSPSADMDALARLYGGNPLALHLVSEPIRELFGGDVGAFLATGDAFFNGVGRLLEQQFARSTPLEQAILYWLAIEREWATLQALLADLGPMVPQRAVLGALESLSRRLHIEHSVDRPAFRLQPVILEYVTDRLVGSMLRAIVDTHFEPLQHYSLILSTAREYVQRSQELLIAVPLLEQLAVVYGDASTIEQQLLYVLDSWRNQSPSVQGYGPGNIINLLRLLRGHLCGLNLAQLAIRQANFQGTELQDTTLAGSTIFNSVFTESFDAMIAVAVTRAGEYWAAASGRGEVRIWAVHGQVLSRVWRAHTDMIWALAFSSDGDYLASGSWDGWIKVWHVASGSLMWQGQHASLVKWLEFSPDDRMLASSGNDGMVRLWNAHSGAELQTLPHHVPVPALSWRADGQVLATGDREGYIRLWEMRPAQPARCVQTLVGHTNWVDGLDFAPDGCRLASVGWDRTVKVWDTTNVQSQPALLQTLTGHTDWVLRVAWSADGRTIASCSRDQTVHLWDAVQYNLRMVLQGHSAGINGLAFIPDSRSLLTGSTDGTLRLWDIGQGQSLRVIQGYATTLYDVDWSPDGAQLASGGADMQVTIYSTQDRPPRVLEGYSGVIFGIGWSRDGRWIASSEWDNIIRLWDPAVGVGRRVLQHPADSGNVFYSLAWNPRDLRLVCGTNRRGVHLFDLTDQRSSWPESPFPAWIRQLAWNPDGTQLAGGSDDGHIYLWDAANGSLLRRWLGHQSMVTCLCWNATGTRLASGSGNNLGGELIVWDAQHGVQIQAIPRHPGMVYAVAWGIHDDIVVSGAGDGMLRWWDMQRAECIHVRSAHQGTLQALRRSPDGIQLASCGDDGAVKLWDTASAAALQTLRRDRPYERLDITGTRGITEAQRTALIALGAIDTLSD